MDLTLSGYLIKCMQLIAMLYRKNYYSHFTTFLWIGTAVGSFKTTSVVLMVRGPGLDSRGSQSFLEVVGLELNPLSLLRITEGPLEWKISVCGLENRG
jgi:hypothetical protein